MKQLRATLNTLLGEGGPKAPAEWLDLLASIVLATDRGKVTAGARLGILSGHARRINLCQVSHMGL
eukprot:scaffold674840_cov29-Prasinocladus_malaysianus.AAC.1